MKSEQAKGPGPSKLERCHGCGCELSYREWQNGVLCFICARNKADRRAAEDSE